MTWENLIIMKEFGSNKIKYIGEIQCTLLLN